ncbi:hypothetical protein ACM66B_002367 [Microbotryomycetes sp. NB124-2]
MPQAQRQDSWSFSLHDDYSDQSSGDEQPPARSALQNGGTESLHVNPAPTNVPDEPCLVNEDVFDIGQVEEGDVKFVETPFTIARRVAASNKSSGAGAANNATSRFRPASKVARPQAETKPTYKGAPKSQQLTNRAEVLDSQTQRLQSTVHSSSSSSPPPQRLFTSDVVDDATSHPTSDGPDRDFPKSRHFLTRPDILEQPTLAMGSQPTAKTVPRSSQSRAAQATIRSSSTLPAQSDCFATQPSTVEEPLLHSQSVFGRDHAQSSLSVESFHRCVSASPVQANTERSLIQSPPLARTALHSPERVSRQQTSSPPPRSPPFLYKKTSARASLSRFKHFRPVLPSRHSMHPAPRPAAVPLTATQAKSISATQMTAPNIDRTSSTSSDTRFFLPTFVPFASASTSSKRLSFQPSETFAQFKARTQAARSEQSHSVASTSSNQATRGSSVELEPSGIAFAATVRSVKPGVIVAGNSSENEDGFGRRRNKRTRIDVDRMNAFRGSSLYKR